MTIKIYSLCILAALLVFCCLFIATLALINPFEADFLGHLFFYSSFFGSCFGIIYFAAAFFHKKFFGRLTGLRHIRVATRHSLLFSILLITTLWLQSQRVLGWLNIFLLIIFLTLAEFFFMSKKEKIVNENES